MYLEAKETARLYQLLSDKLGNDTTEAMFKYIDNKTERAVDATVKTLATKDDLANVKYELSKDISETKADMIKWMFIFWIGQVGATLAIMALFIKRQNIEEVWKIASNTANIRKEINESKVDTIKWMFIFWIGQVGAMLAILLLFVTK